MGSRLEKNSESMRRRIANHTFNGEQGDEYGGSKFGGFPEYYRRKKIKLQNLDADIRSQSEGKPNIFRGIVAHVNGYTQPSLRDLHKLIVEHGGGFMQYLDGKTTVTHIIASSLTPKKVVEFAKYRIVKPAWIVDSIKGRKLLPWHDYRVVEEGDKQNVLAFDKSKILSQANVRARGYRDQTDTSWYTNQLRTSQTASATELAPVNSMAPQAMKMKIIDNIEDLPPSHQPEPSFGSQEHVGKSSTTQAIANSLEDGTVVEVAKPKDRNHTADDISDRVLDSLYADPTPPPAAQQEPVEDSQSRDSEATASCDLTSLLPKELTVEEHNSILLRDSKIRRSTVVDPNFLEQYYRESRLHHLSTWKAELKSQLQALASQKTASQKARQKRPPGVRRYVLHIDFDCFFAAVSLKEHPQYKDKPAVVAHGQGGGSEIASCNYAARKFGIKNGMWMKNALELYPDLKILPYNFPAYEEVSRAFYDAIISTGGLVQSVSVDEVLVDVSNHCIKAGGGEWRKIHDGSNHREQARADEIAQSLRDEVKAKTGCDVSVGIGANILLAKLALRKAKPAGQYQIKPEEVLGFIGELRTQDLPGVAASIGGKLEELGVKLIKDIRGLSKERLIQTLGPKTGEKMWEYSRGIDRQEVGDQVVRKSVSAEVNWGVRFENQDQADEFVTSLCGELQKRLLKEKVKGKQFTMKIMRRSPDSPLDPPKHLGHGKCDTHNKSIALGVATTSKEVLAKEALGILRGFGFTPGELRGIGIQMTKLEPIRTAINDNLEGSQRRLQFKTTSKEPAKSHKPPKVFEVDPIQDEPETPVKARKKGFEDDSLGFGPQELGQSTPSRRPLNIMGTQFIMPTQVDPQILAELPDNIRSKLLRQPRQSSPTPIARHTNADASAKRPFSLTALPAQSQLDPDILAALPLDIRHEVLAQYAANFTPVSPSRRLRSGGQTILPQSPRKNRIISVPAKKGLAPVRRARGRPPRSAIPAAAAQATTVGRNGKVFNQANFTSKKNPAGDGSSREASVEPMLITTAAEKAKKNDNDLDPDFLAALPEEVRKEVMDDHHRKKLHALHLAVTRKAKSTRSPNPPHPPLIIQVPRPSRPTFTTKKFWKEKNLRSATKDWIHEFTTEGPYDEDVQALVKYLGRVVSEEKDLAKAVGVVKWLEYVISEAVDELDSFNELEWNDAIVAVKIGVAAAARARGMGNVEFR